MNSPSLILPLNDGQSAERAVFEYVRDRLDKKEFIKELMYSTGDTNWALNMVAPGIAGNLAPGETVTFNEHGGFTTVSAGEKP